MYMKKQTTVMMGAAAPTTGPTMLGSLLMEVMAEEAALHAGATQLQAMPVSVPVMA